MATVREVLGFIESIAPPSNVWSEDNIGLLVGDPDHHVTRGVCCLDASECLVADMLAIRPQLVVAHHPIIFRPIRAITPSVPQGRVMLRLLEHRISVIGAHTNWDAALGGISDALADRLGLVNVKVVGKGFTTETPFKLVVFVPSEHRERLIDALGEAGAGVMGEYERCAFWSDGTGTFHASEGANPAVGKKGETNQVAEQRLEMRVPASALHKVLASLRKHHPYEEPAFDLIPLKTESTLSSMRLGHLPEAMTLHDLARHVDLSLKTRCMAWGDPHRMVEKIAVIGGAADSTWPDAAAAGADVFLTGEIAHHQTMMMASAGLTCIAAGHFATENPGMQVMNDRLAERFPEIEWTFLEPQEGRGGAPLILNGNKW